MTVLTGGIRLRLLRDSAIHLVTDGLSSQGWFDTDRRHRPVSVIANPVQWDQPVEPNLVTVTIDNVGTSYFELGSGLTEDSVRILTDLYVESDTLGVELANDVRDIFRGRIGTGAARAELPIWDFRLATPVVLAHAALDDVRILRPILTVQQNWQRFWFTVTVQAHDFYYTAEG